MKRGSPAYRPLLSRVATALLGFALALLLARSQFLARSWGDFLVSVRFFAAGPVQHVDPIIIRIDEESIEQLGPWPWPRHLYAQALSILDLEGPSAIGVDLLFQKPDPINDPVFAAALSETETPVVLGSELKLAIVSSLWNQDLLDQGEQPSLFEAVPKGYLNLIQDRDGLIRTWPFHEDSTMLSFAERIYQSATGQNPPIVGSALINFRGNRDAFPSISFLQLLEKDYPPGVFAGRIVLIGLTAENTDRHRTGLAALGAVPGVYLHAYLIRNLLDGNWLRPLPGWASFLLLLGVSGLWAAVLPRRPGYLTLLLTIGAGIAVFFAGVSAGFFGYILPVPALLVMLFLEPIVLLVQSYVREREERQKIKGLFAKCVSQEILKEILLKKDEISFEGEQRFVAAFFADVRGFTSLAEDQQPEQVVTEINTILGRMASIVHHHGGLVNKFLGDGIMAVFGIPVWEDSTIRSVFAACKEIVGLHGILSGKTISLGIGLAWGMVIAGCVGNEDRLEYTVMGPPVNLAARLEELAGPGEVVFPYDQRFESDLPTESVAIEQVQLKGISKPILVARIRRMEEAQ